MIYPGFKKKTKRETKTLTDFHSNYLQKTFQLSLKKGPSLRGAFLIPWNSDWWNTLERTVVTLVGLCELVYLISRSFACPCLIVWKTSKIFKKNSAGL